MKTFVFPGQGSQAKGMGGRLFDEYSALTARADDILGYSIKALCLDDPGGELNQTQFTQPAIYVVNALSYFKALDEGGGKPDVVAGHSLGEYNALLASGVFDFETGLRLVKERGRLMSRMSGGAMAAILGLSAQQVEEVLGENGLTGVDVANYNTPTQIVISGLKEDLALADKCFEHVGAHYVSLKTSGAFHSRHMREVGGQFREFLSRFSFSAMTIPVIANVSARPYVQEALLETLSKQISCSVHWSESIRYLMGLGDMAFEEIGHGVVLTKLIQKIKRESTPLVVAARNQGASLSVSTPALEGGRGGQPATVKTPAMRQAPRSPELIFMYGGQGSQYYQMGRELYRKDSVFKSTMDRCDAVLRPQLGQSLVGVIYDESKQYETFDQILYTHPAIVCVQYCLTQVLHERGLRPDAVLGYSLGEYIAAIVAGVLTLEEGLALVARQAQYLHEHCGDGGMLVVLDPVAGFSENSALFEGCTLAGVNYEGNYIVSGTRACLEGVHARLEAKSVFSQMLPVKQAFHSPLIDPIGGEFKQACESVGFAPPNMPLYSSVRVGEVSRPDGDYLWDVVRGKIEFKTLLSTIVGNRHALFVDMSPTGTLCNLVKYGFEKQVTSYFAMNQFGQDLRSVENVLGQLKDYNVAV